MRTTSLQRLLQERLRQENILFTEVRANQREMVGAIRSAHSWGPIDLIAVEVRGDIDPDRLVSAHKQVLAEQSELHLRLSHHQDTFELCEFSPVDVSIQMDSTTDAVQADVRQMMQTSIDPFRGMLGRAALHQLDKETYIILVPLHHLVSDESSHGVYAHNLAEIYGGERSRVAAYGVPTQHDSETVAADINLQAQKLASPRFSLFDRDRKPSGVAKRQSAELPTAPWQDMKRLSLSSGVPPTCAIIGAAAAAAQSVFQGEDVRVATAISNRWTQESQRAIALLATQHVIRYRGIAGASTADYARHATKDILATASRPAVPLAAVAQILRSECVDDIGHIGWLYELSLAYGEFHGAAFEGPHAVFRVMRGAEAVDDHVPAFVPIHLEVMEDSGKSLQVHSFCDSGLVSESEARTFVDELVDKLAVAKWDG